MRPSPVPALVGLSPYSAHPLPDTAGALARADLILSGNEGAEPPAHLLASLAGCSTDLLRRYPSAAELEATLARRHGVAPEQVLVTCGADDALDRCCRAFLDPSRAAFLPVPTFEMLLRYAALTGARLCTPRWEGDYPEVASPDAPLGLVGLVSPNNPTGATVTAADLRGAAAAHPGALVLLDHAYIEFADADADLTALALTLPNVIVTRTLSKAYGLAGLRVGYAAGPADLIRCLRLVGAPFAVSGLALHLAARCLADPTTEPALQAFISRVREERRALSQLLRRSGQVYVYPSQANFVLSRLPDAARVYGELLADGIAVRAFASPELRACLRITCPGEARAFTRLCDSLTRILP